MAKICVEITLDTDTGAYSVMECEPEDEGMEAGQTFQSAEEAMSAAAEMLQAGATGQQDMSTLKDAIQGGYDKVRGPAMQSGRMSPGAGMFGEE